MCDNKIMGFSINELKYFSNSDLTPIILILQKNKLIEDVIEILKLRPDLIDITIAYIKSDWELVNKNLEYMMYKRLHLEFSDNEEIMLAIIKCHIKKEEYDIALEYFYNFEPGFSYKYSSDLEFFLKIICQFKCNTLIRIH